MIVVRVELHSAISGRVTELARMIITNTGGGTQRIGDYSAMTLRGRSAEALDQRQPQRQGVVKAFPRQTLHVWKLVADALRGMGYGRRRGAVAQVDVMEHAEHG